MPFASEFDDVYLNIKHAVEGSVTKQSVRCIRLDDQRPAGRITHRLLDELRASTFCVADISDCRPNVMWELGFAMALEKPVILITQDDAYLPFDIHDMLCVKYERQHLSRTLLAPLKQSVIDTLSKAEASRPGIISCIDPRDTVMAEMRDDLAEFKKIISNLDPKLWNNEKNLEARDIVAIEALEGHWENSESHSHMYAKIIAGELVAPYCYMGNEKLTAVYFGWRKAGEHWYARYQWLEEEMSGFTFLRHESVDRLVGAWWSSDMEENVNLTSPPKGTGVSSDWSRIWPSKTPAWAEDFFKSVKKKGLSASLKTGV